MIRSQVPEPLLSSSVAKIPFPGGRSTFVVAGFGGGLLLPMYRLRRDQRRVCLLLAPLRRRGLLVATWWVGQASSLLLRAFGLGVPHVLHRVRAAVLLHWRCGGGILLLLLLLRLLLARHIIFVLLPPPPLLLLLRCRKTPLPLQAAAPLHYVTDRRCQGAARGQQAGYTGGAATAVQAGDRGPKMRLCSLSVLQLL
eukprot:COSAG05_NODE_660_length_8054_cov_3.180264_10_plen_197_part_00